MSAVVAAFLALLAGTAMDDSSDTPDDPSVYNPDAAYRAQARLARGRGAWGPASQATAANIYGGTDAFVRAPTGL